MPRRWCLLPVLICVCAYAVAVSSKQTSARLPVTTSSAEARQRFERAMRYYERYDMSQTLSDLREAAKADPDFAQALILISHLSRDPVEQAATRKHAKQLAPKVSGSEQLLIRWMAGAQENDYLPAIAAMNDLLERFPNDERLAFMAGGWLNSQQRYDQAVFVLERAVTAHPNYPAALNNLAYAYAYTGAFEKAFAAMDRYIALEPDQANPHDSYGELLRMDGKFDAALEQYRMSVQIDPNFGSEVGIADTYALMGKEQEAREEYDRAMVFAASRGDKVEFQLQSAQTWIRENNPKAATKALAEVEKEAHAAGLGRWEAEAHRMAAMCQPEYKVALKELQSAQHALEEHPISASDHDEEQARVLRVLVTRAAEATDMQMAIDSLNQLSGMAEKSKSQAIRISYQSAAGAVLVAQENFTEAIPHLEEAAEDPMAMQFLWKCYSRSGATEQAQALAAKLTGLNVPTVEQALVVPRFRENMLSQAAQQSH